MARTNRRTTVLAGVAFVAAATLLTACQGSDSDANGAAKSSTSDKAGKAAPASPASSPAQSADTEQESARTGAGTAAKSRGVNGTWFGNVSYLAPGKFTVSGVKGKQQAFFVSDSTLIKGTGDICGQDGGKAQKCTEAELEAAAKKGVSAKVILKNGIAVSVIDDA